MVKCLVENNRLHIMNENNSIIGIVDFDAGDIEIDIKTNFTIGEFLDLTSELSKFANKISEQNK